MINTDMAAEAARAVHARLASHVAVKTWLGDPARLYDTAPEDPVFPYLTYGDIRTEDKGGDGVQATCHTMNLHIWSRYGGRSETIAAMAAVTSALEDTPLTADGGAELIVTIPYTDVLRAPDGRTRHGLIRVKVYSRAAEVLT